MWRDDQYRAREAGIKRSELPEVRMGTRHSVQAGGTVSVLCE